MAGSVQPRCDPGKQNHHRPEFSFLAGDKREALGATTVSAAPEDRCDSGLDCLSGAEESFSNETSQTWGSRSPETSQTWGSRSPETSQTWGSNETSQTWGSRNETSQTWGSRNETSQTWGSSRSPLTSNETSQTWGSSRSPLTSSCTSSLYDTDKRPMDCSSLGSGEIERLDSAIGDSITDETMGSISHGLGTMHLSEPVVSDKDEGKTGRQEAPSPEEERRRREEMFNTLNFVSEDGDTALHLALIHEHWAFVQYLLGVIALDQSWVPYLDIQNHLGQTALHLAVIVDQPQCVRGLLWGGASAELQERGGNTPLHLAVRELRHNCVREITSNSQSTDYLHITNYSGVSPLHLAVQRCREDIVSMLVEAGADVNQRDLGSGRSPLHWAVEAQGPRVVQLLLQTGASVDQPSYAGHTALYCALHRPNKEVQALLKAEGASATRGQDEEEEEEEEEEERESEEEEFDDVVINGQRVH